MKVVVTSITVTEHENWRVYGRYAGNRFVAAMIYGHFSVRFPCKRYGADLTDRSCRRAMKAIRPIAMKTAKACTSPLPKPFGKFIAWGRTWMDLHPKEHIGITELIKLYKEATSTNTTAEGAA